MIYCKKEKSILTRLKFLWEVINELFFWQKLSSQKGFSYLNCPQEGAQTCFLYISEIKDKNENFGSSLLLSNVPMSPKIVNASFAAIYDQGDVLEQFTKTIKLRKDAQDSPGSVKYDVSKWNWQFKLTAKRQTTG